MIQVRENVFETNSSSTHSICISKSPIDARGRKISFHLDDFGWEEGIRNTANYLYTAIMYLYDEEGRDDRVGKLKSVLDKYDVEYEFEEPVYEKWGEYDYLVNGEIDHAESIGGFVETVLNDEDMLLRCLFGDSVVYTGNDNDCGGDEDRMCLVAENKHYVYNEETDKYDIVYRYDHPEADPENYDYFFKGN